MPTSKLLIAAVVGGGAVIAALTTYRTPRDTTSADITRSFGDRLGYLRTRDLPNGVALLPPPPAPGSLAMRKDEEARNAALLLQGTPRFELAAADAVRAPDTTVKAFQCAFGTDISPERTPVLYKLLLRFRLDVRAASYPAKEHFRRPRPYVVHQSRTCYPQDEDNVRNDGSYPSARGAVGWAYALVLADLNPARAGAILQRGRDFGESRVVCDQEWQSDIDAGRALATETVARLRTTEAFRADLENARREVAAEQAAGTKPASDCALERAALATPGRPKSASAR
jgi:acid phosphatase (class A)